MKALHIFILSALLMALAITNLSATPSGDEPLFVDNDGDGDRSQAEPTSVGIMSRFLAQKPRGMMTCNKYPRVCRAAGSPGPDCCERKCVNVMWDRFNCGKCDMKFLNLFFMLSIVMALVAITLSAITSEKSDHPLGNSQMAASFRGAGGFPTQGFRPFLTCDKQPEICSMKGLFCCNRRCVDLKTEQFNCGRCGKTCNYSSICCEGKCVSPLFDENHCGGCNNSCGKGSSCVYGMCNYA
ncbi:hypothetical protein Gorai_012137 [Gossypium raimondii]|uniref:Stigma-specific STIG1-like protein 1 n=2 Tax=Gossypium raimondii TaxID=29730 RepID=A0A7J8Q200_GOSRA|nr:hypothetical protein [Gossypium raimondii]